MPACLLPAPARLGCTRLCSRGAHSPAGALRAAPSAAWQQRRHRNRRRRVAARRDWLPAPFDEGDGWQGRAWADRSSSSDEEEDSEDELDLFPQEAAGDPEFVVENVLATALIGLASLAAAIILFKLLIVMYSLVSAAIRYTVIGMVLIVGLVTFQPGRWWF